MSEMEKKTGDRAGTIPSAAVEIIEKAGQRSLEEISVLTQSVEAVLNDEQKKGESRIRNAETIGDIETGKGKTNIEHFNEGGIGFHRIESGKLICASDTHGDFAALSSALKEFIKRKEAGEEAYFNFSGDFYTSDSAKDGLPQIEALLAAKAKYPQSVFWETGNADRAHISFFVGMGTEIVRRFAGEDVSQQIERKGQEALDDFCLAQYGGTFSEIENETSKSALSSEEKEKKYPKFASVKKFGKIFFDNAVFLQEARACGANVMDATDFPAKFIYKKLGDILIASGKDEEGKKREDKSRLSLARHLGRSLVVAVGSYSKERQTDADAEKIQQAFELYKRIAGAMNKMPVMNILNIPSQNKNILLVHSFPVGTERLSQLVYDPVAQRRAAWNKYFEEQAGIKERKTDELAHGPDTLRDWFLKNNVVLGQFGHNHGNRISELGEGMFRLEVATTTRAKKQPGVLNEAAFAIVDISRIAELEKGTWQNVVEFIKAKS